MLTSAEFTVDVIVIGAGQAGLAAAYYLQQQQADFVVLDDRQAVGDVWATRFDALTLFSPAWVSDLPGRAWSGNRLRYPSKDEASRYLHDYATHFRFPIHLQQRVVRVRPRGAGGYSVFTAAGQHYQARAVIVCTGAYNAPRQPGFAQELAPTVRQLHSQQYQRPEQLSGQGPVAVVGSGNSALQIAADLAVTGRPVYAAYDARTPDLPNNTAMWAFLAVTGLLRASRHTLLGAKLRLRPEPVVSSDLSRLRHLPNVTFIGRALQVDNATALRGYRASTPALEHVVWATGYGPAFDWLEVPVLDAEGEPRHHRGMTQAPGLAFLGLPWLNSRSSALMGGAGPDARYVVEHLLKTS
ncbi:NAD(P)/FAD-dependent oxidoreductase [Hymenobacter fastidiosus]|uniref:NAD(P)/FAD-dependent oxidoreductase n=1 Tax=Hymenobacter fastidiosus TaxID=486264 RepID=A0ABP7SLH6_9BACT